MASEILQSPQSKALPSNLQGVATGISKAAVVQAKEALDYAIQSFNSIKEKQADFTGFDEASIPVAGHVESPVKYFAQGGRTNVDGLASTDDVVARLRLHNFQYQQGIASFLKSGIQEALAGLKIKTDPTVVQPQIPIPLDELITPEKLRNPDRKTLQTSVHAVNEMFKALRNLHGDVSHMRLRILNSVRV
jgi:hypothetical protein